MARRANVASTARREQFTFCVAIALVHLTITTLSFRAQARLERPCSLGVMNSTFCS